MQEPGKPQQWYRCGFFNCNHVCIAELDINAYFFCLNKTTA